MSSIFRYHFSMRYSSYDLNYLKQLISALLPHLILIFAVVRLLAWPRIVRGNPFIRWLFFRCHARVSENGATDIGFTVNSDCCVPVLKLISQFSFSFYQHACDARPRPANTATKSVLNCTLLSIVMTLMSTAYISTANLYCTYNLESHSLMKFFFQYLIQCESTKQFVIF